MLLRRRIEELHSMGVYIVCITKGKGRLVDTCLQMADLRRFFRGIYGSENSVGCKLLTLQVLMNTEFEERLRPCEAALVDDDTKNLLSDLTCEQLAKLPPAFRPTEPADGSTGADFYDGHLTEPILFCRLMRVQQGIRDWQLDELVQAASPNGVAPERP